jgi:hypothetical protein
MPTLIKYHLNINFLLIKKERIRKKLENKANQLLKNYIETGPNNKLKKFYLKNKRYFKKFKNPDFKNRLIKFENTQLHLLKTLKAMLFNKNLKQIKYNLIDYPCTLEYTLSEKEKEILFKKFIKEFKPIYKDKSLLKQLNYYISTTKLSKNKSKAIMYWRKNYDIQKFMLEQYKIYNPEANYDDFNLEPVTLTKSNFIQLLELDEYHKEETQEIIRNWEIYEKNNCTFEYNSWW